MPSTALCTQFKADLLNGAHCFGATMTPTISSTSSTSVTAVSSMSGIAVGMSVSGNASIPANTVVARITSSTALTLSNATTGTITAAACTFAGDVFRMALIKVAPSGTWDATATNYGSGSGAPTTSNLGTDEVASGGGYTTGGLALTNVSAVTSGVTGYVTFSPDPSWSSATFSTVAAMIYNASTVGRLGGVVNRAVSIHDFSGTQSVSAGVLTIVMPAAAAATAIIRLS